MKDPHRQESEWFTDTVQDNSNEGIMWRAFEGELSRAITAIKSHGHSPVIRMSERMFQLMLKGKYTQVIGACWSVYMFRGYPLALRESTHQWSVVEVLDDNGDTSCAFKVRNTK